ncbi:hypothetical protein N7475_001599 [Penicillium sp. IBT 31633x]|nr:hypothetical protein N7475_001599 [Penicillium sp. IBT 31633x]
MRILSALALSALLTPATCTSKPPGKDAILLSNVQTLTLRANRMTNSRRVSPIPQLSCVGPKQTCKLYQPEVMRCTNQGYDYDEEDVQWTCTADLPAEFKLGATDVICEGYRNADDKWVLKGSCGVEYRMLLTDAGEKKFGWKNRDTQAESSQLGLLGNLIFYGFMAAVFLFILSPILAQLIRWATGGQRGEGQGQGGGGWGGWGGGGGGGGGGGWGGGGDPPPPYSSFDPNKSAGRQQGWRPGFWTGALGGAAAGYQMGRRRDNGSRYRTPMDRSDARYDPGEGSSRSSPQFSSTTSSTGFGSTRRR